MSYKPEWQVNLDSHVFRKFHIEAYKNNSGGTVVMCRNCMAGERIAELLSCNEQQKRSKEKCVN